MSFMSVGLFAPSVVAPPAEPVGTYSYTKQWTQTYNGSRFSSIEWDEGSQTLVAVDAIYSGDINGSHLIDVDISDGSFTQRKASVAARAGYSSFPQLGWPSPELTYPDTALASYIWNTGNAVRDADTLTSRQSLAGYNTVSGCISPNGRWLWLGSVAVTTGAVWRIDLTDWSVTSWALSSGRVHGGTLAALDDGSAFVADQGNTLYKIASDMTTDWSRTMQDTSANALSIPVANIATPQHGWHDAETGRYYLTVFGAHDSDYRFVWWPDDNSGDATDVWVNDESDPSLAVQLGWRIRRDRSGGWWIMLKRTSGDGFDFVRLDSDLNLIHRMSISFPSLDLWTEFTVYSKAHDFDVVSTDDGDFLLVCSYVGSATNDGVDGKITCYSIDAFTGSDGLTVTGTDVSVSTVGGDSLITFASGTGTYYVSGDDIVADILVVGGGGAGGGGYNGWNAGGGGGGGVVYETAYTLTGDAGGSVVVGEGGAATVPPTEAEAGEDSSFGVLVAEGGGRGADVNGGSVAFATGGAGGCGGGGSSYFGAKPGGTGSQGGNGGTGFEGSQFTTSAGGGGGGAGPNNGANAASSAGGNGGDGIAISITGSSVTYGGGGGGTAQTGTPGTGGAGGGGAGGSRGVAPANVGGDGTDGIGGGGGGGTGSSAGVAGNGGAGGRGVVIIRTSATVTVAT